MVDIIHRIGIKAPISKVYAALSTVEGIAGWWTREASGFSTVGGTIGVRFLSVDGKEIGRMNMEVITLVSNKKVHWRFSAEPEEWIGTDMVFHLSQEREGDGND